MDVLMPLTYRRGTLRDSEFLAATAEIPVRGSLQCETSERLMTATGLVSRVAPVQTAVRNCTRDEGGPFGFGDQVADPKPPQAAVAKSHGSERCGNIGT